MNIKMASLVILSGIVGCTVPAGSDSAVGAPPADTAPIPSVGLLPPPTGGALTATVHSSNLSTPGVAVSAALAVTTYQWTQAQGFSTVMFNQNDGWCFLSKVAGHFVGFGEAVYITASNGFWVLAGQSQQQGVSAQATCVPWAALDPSFNTASYTWDNYTSVSNNSNCWQKAVCREAVRQLWGPDALCVLLGVGGAFDGGGEAVSVNISPGNPWKLAIDSQQPNGTEGWAGCFAFDNGLHMTNEIDWFRSRGTSVPISGSYMGCGLSYLTGGLFGAGDSASCLPAWSLNGTGFLQIAGARCVTP